MEPSSDEKTMAGLAHLTAALPQFGLIAAIVIWATQKDKSPYVSFQALQAIIYHVAFIIIWVIGMGIYVLAFFATVAFSFVPSREGFPFAFLVIPFTFLLLFGTIFIFVGYGIYGAISCFQGKDFRYLIIGNVIARIQKRS